MGLHEDTSPSGGEDRRAAIQRVDKAYGGWSPDRGCYASEHQRAEGGTTWRWRWWWCWRAGDGGAAAARGDEAEDEFTKSFGRRTAPDEQGHAEPFFPLVPNWQLALAGEEEGDEPRRSK
jgi:hypothetical protein